MNSPRKLKLSQQEDSPKSYFQRFKLKQQEKLSKNSQNEDFTKSHEAPPPPYSLIEELEKLPTLTEWPLIQSTWKPFDINSLKGISTWKGESHTLKAVSSVAAALQTKSMSIVCGQVQSGKSMFIVYFSLFVLRTSDYPVFIILRNNTADIDSLESKFNSVGINCFRNTSGVGQGVFLLTGNALRLKCINRKCILIMDELDYNEKESITKFAQELEAIKESRNVVHCAGLTATYRKSLERNVDYVRVDLSTVASYRGIDDLEFRPFYDLKESLNDILKRSSSETVKVLYKGSNIKTQMHSITAKGWTVVVWNGDGVYVDGLLVKETYYSVMQRQKGRVLVISGILASRGISFGIDYIILDCNVTKVVGLIQSIGRVCGVGMRGLGVVYCEEGVENVVKGYM